jgi:ABC-2 type transport system permease protein
MPLTHGLAGIRAMLAGDTVRALAQLGLEAAVGVGWLSIAAVSTQRLVSRGRVDGSIEFT